MRIMVNVHRSDVPLNVKLWLSEVKRRSCFRATQPGTNHDFMFSSFQNVYRIHGSTFKIFLWPRKRCYEKNRLSLFLYFLFCMKIYLIFLLTGIICAKFWKYYAIGILPICYHFENLRTYQGALIKMISAWLSHFNPFKPKFTIVSSSIQAANCCRNSRLVWMKMIWNE